MSDDTKIPEVHTINALTAPGTHYSRLTKDERQSLLGDNNSPYQIGGRDTDVEQLAWTFQSLVRENYPINEVPDIQHRRVTALLHMMRGAEQCISEIIEDLAKHVIESRVTRAV